MSDKGHELVAVTLKQRARYAAVFVGIVIVLILIVIWNINSGSVKMSPAEVFRIIFLGEGDETKFNIIWKLRFPRIIMSAVLGGALALSGFLMQTFFSNPIAGPFVLGISSGAKLFVAATMVLVLKMTNHVSSLMMVIAAFVGSLICMGFVLLAARSIKQMSMLLVAGIMISYICSAVTEFIITFAQDSDIVNLHGWSQGSFSGMDWNDVVFASVLIFITFFFVFMLAKPIGAYQMGENYAQSMGVNVKRFRIVLILLSTLLAGCVTAFAGPVSFVGVAVPHLIKGLFGTARPIML